MLPRWRIFDDFFGPAFPASRSTFQTCILKSHYRATPDTMCKSMVDIQSATAEIGRGKKKNERRNSTKI